MEFTHEYEARLEYLTQKIAQLRMEQRLLYDLQSGRIKTLEEFDAKKREIENQIEPQEADIYERIKKSAIISEAEEKAREIIMNAESVVEDIDRSIETF